MTDMLGMNRKTKSSDELYDIFLKHLEKESLDTETVQDLIYEVVAEYFSVLFQKGNVPQHLMDSIELDLREEVMEMYRKKTYGFHSLQEYRKSKNQNSKIRSS
jgi:hypothetical protein